MPSGPRWHRRMMRDDRCGVGAKRSISAAPVGQQGRGATKRLMRRDSSGVLRALHQRNRASTCIVCRRPMSSARQARSRDSRADLANARRPAVRGGNVRFSAAPGSNCASWAGSRRPASVFASPRPATTDDQSGAAAATMSPWHGCASEQSHGFPKERPSFAAAVSTARNSSSIAAESFAIDFARVRVRGEGRSTRQAIAQSPPWSELSPSRLTPILKSSSASVPSPTAACPHGGRDCGRGGRFARQAVGTRTMTPAASRRGVSVSS